LATGFAAGSVTSVGRASTVGPGASSPDAADTIRIVDDLGRTHAFPGAPVRIVTLVPVAAEILFSLGEGDRIVGRSRYADYPAALRDVPSVGDAIRPSTELVVSHRPDLIILVAGADNRSAVDAFDRLGIPSVAIVINTFADLERNILRLGALTDADSVATALLESVQADLGQVEYLTAGLDRPTVYYDVGFPPAFTIGAGSYLDSLIVIAGGRNVFGDISAPSAQVSLEALVSRDPDLIIVPVPMDGRPAASSPAERSGWDLLRAARPERIRTVDIDLVSRLGPRIGLAARELAMAIHPELAGRWPGTEAGRP
jgi:ABC-type Fe3+-hydroxamate transport system substrate-binding protein